MRKFLSILILVIVSESNLIAQVGINTASPNITAALDVVSTTKGFLPPRMTKVQRDAIGTPNTPAEGLLVTCTDCDIAGLYQYINGAWQALSSCLQVGNYGTVMNPVTGKVWLDRNLGATQVANSSTDALGFGDLYQWGRGADGHQVRSSGNSISQATDWFSGSGAWKGLFITIMTSPFNWLSTGDTYMWSGTAAENNPCPSGFRIPTIAEWEQERRTWLSSNETGAYTSLLKLPMAGGRNNGNGSIGSVNLVGYYWSSTVSNNMSRAIYFGSGEAGMTSGNRALGFSVRCIKD
ncbi:MAG: FISUMP domain-containing protein [Saprospiraceae bacterium]